MVVYQHTMVVYQFFLRQIVKRSLIFIASISRDFSLLPICKILGRISLKVAFKQSYHTLQWLQELMQLNFFWQNLLSTALIPVLSSDRLEW